MSGWKNLVARRWRERFSALGLVLATSLVSWAPPAEAAGCPTYPGQTNEEIILKIEGRLNGDWKTVLRTVQKSITRLKSEGKDTTDPELYYSVLYCLNQAVQDGEYADVVADAKGRPSQRAVEETVAPTEEAPSVEDGASATNAETGEPAPAVQEAPAVVPVEAPPGTAQSFEPIIVTSEGVVTPTPTPVPEPAPALAPAQVASVPPGGYAGQMCAFFTRPLDEVINGIAYHNVYGEGAWVCHQNEMYACEAGVWTDKGICTQYNKWETRQSQVLEAR